MSDAREPSKSSARRKGPAKQQLPDNTSAIHSAIRPVPPACNSTPQESDSMQLGAIKEVLHQFAAARRDVPKERLSLELRELYRFLCRQAQLTGIDPARALELYRADAARRQPSAVPRQLPSSTAFLRSTRR